MKKRLILISLAVIMVLSLFTGCGEKITLENVENYETSHRYSKVSGGSLKQCAETKIIKDAKEFTNQFLTIMYNRTYKANTSVEHETIMFSDEYLEKNKQSAEEKILYIKGLYSNYGISTELMGIDYESIVDVNGDAYVKCVAKVRLTECNNPVVAGLIGYSSGVNSNALCAYNIKLQYKDRNYIVYDYSVEEKDGYLLSFEKYDSILQSKMTEEDKLNQFAYLFAKAQNDRIYYTFNGDEDQKYLSKSCLAEINKDGDYAANQKKLYSGYKLSTRLNKCTVTGITKTDAGYTINAELDVEMLQCGNKQIAERLGFPSGIGSIRKMKYLYYVIIEDGEYKIDATEFLG